MTVLRPVRDNGDQMSDKKNTELVRATECFTWHRTVHGLYLEEKDRGMDPPTMVDVGVMN